MLAGTGPPGWPQGSHRSRGHVAGIFPLQTAGIAVRLLCFQDPPPSYYFLACFPFPCLPFGSSPARQTLCIDPVQDWLSCLRTRPTCRQPPAGAVPRQVLLSFARRAPRTAGEVKDSWTPVHSQGRSRGLDSFLPVPTSPGVFCVQRTLRPYLVASSLCPLGKPLIPLKGKLSSRFGYSIAKRALGADFALGLRQLQQQSKPRTGDSALLGLAPVPTPAAETRCQEFPPESFGTLLISPGVPRSSGTPYRPDA